MAPGVLYECSCRRKLTCFPVCHTRIERQIAHHELRAMGAKELQVQAVVAVAVQLVVVGMLAGRYITVCDAVCCIGS